MHQIITTQNEQLPVTYISSERVDSSSLYGSIGVCYVSPKHDTKTADQKDDGYYVLSPRALTSNFFTEGDDTFGYESTKVSILKKPAHGIISEDLSENKNITYYPNDGYIGNDTASFLVDFAGKNIKIEYFIKVVDGAIKSKNILKAYKEVCPSPDWWIVNPHKKDTGKL